MTTNARPTVRDVAQHAGVSIATVSRVMNNDPRVAPKTRDLVLASVAELDYQPSALGKGLANRSFAAIGVVLPGLGGPYFAELLQGIDSVAADVAVHVLSTHLRPDANDDIRRLGLRTDGLITLGGTIEPAIAADLAARQPVVVVADESPELMTVRVDGRSATRELTEHLLDTHGYTRLRFVGADPSSPDACTRHNGFLDALSGRGLAPAGEPFTHGLADYFGASTARKLDASDDMPEAIVCANDELAMGMLATLPGLGYAVPDDVAIVGFDDIPLASLASPTLTTVHHPIGELGARAAQIVLAGRAQGRQVFTPLAPNDLVLPTELMLRESCGCR